MNRPSTFSTDNTIIGVSTEDQLENNLLALSTKVDNIDTLVNNNITSISTIFSDIVELTNRANTTDTSISNINSNIDTLTTKITTINTFLETTFDSIPFIDRISLPVTYDGQKVFTLESTGLIIPYLTVGGSIIIDFTIDGNQLTISDTESPRYANEILVGFSFKNIGEYNA